MKRSIFFSVLFLASASIAIAQDKPTKFEEATKVDEIGKTGCEDLLVRTHDFGLSLQKNPSQRGVVLSHLTDTIKTDSQIRFIHRYLISAFGNGLNVIFLKGAIENELRTEFWLVPSNVQFQPRNAVVSMTIPFEIDKKILFGYDDPSPCTGHVFYGFATMLKADTNLSGYIVNLNNSRREQQEIAEYYRNEFKEKRITGRGIRIYFKTRKHKPNEYYANNEYWLYPKH